MNNTNQFQLVIPRNKQYTFENQDVFSFFYKECIYRAVSKDFTKVHIDTLRVLAKYARNKKYYKLDKKNLVDYLNKSIIYE